MTAEVLNFVSFGRTSVPTPWMKLSEDWLLDVRQSSKTLYILYVLSEEKKMDSKNSILIRARKLDHNGVIHYLLKLGNLTSHVTYTHHKSGKYKGVLLGNVATKNDISKLVKPIHAEVVKRIDVVWFKERRLSNCFEVVHTTSMPQSALKLHQVLDCENLDVVHLVFPAKRKNQYHKLSNMCPFDKEWGKYDFVVYERLLEVYDIVKESKGEIEESERKMEEALSLLKTSLH